MNSTADGSRKRPRPVVSCLRCRQKKLKCDRALPCQNCEKAECSADCSYNQCPSDASPRVKLPRLESYTDPKYSVQPVNEASELGDTGLSADLSHPVSNVENTPSGEFSAQPRLCGKLVPKSSRTRYYGHDDRATVLNYFPEAKEFIDDSMEDPAFLTVAREVQSLQKDCLMRFKIPKVTQASAGSPAMQKLRDFLPRREACIPLLELYEIYFEQTHRILHIPSFFLQCRLFWKDQAEVIRTSPAFLPQLTAVLAIAVTLRDPDLGVEVSGVKNYLLSPALDLIQAWIDGLGRKQRIEFSTLQVETLLVQARQLRHMPDDELWRATGALTRSAMAIGLHHDPAPSEDISVFQTEMRRRLWATVVELDFQASMMNGMPISLPESGCTHFEPANLEDDDFDELTKELPTPEPLHHPTRSLALVTLAKSLPVRIKAMALIRSGRSGGDVAEVLRVGRELEQLLQQVPEKLKPWHLDGYEPGVLLNSFLVDLYIRRALLCFWVPLLSLDRSSDPTSHRARVICLESSMEVLTYQRRFQEEVRDAEADEAVTFQWQVANTFCKHDVLGASLNACRYIHFSSREPIFQCLNPRLSYSKCSSHGRNDLIGWVNGTLDGFRRNVMQSGINIKDVVFLTIILQSALGNGAYGDPRAQMKEAASFALAQCKDSLRAYNYDTIGYLVPTDPSKISSAALRALTSSQMHEKLRFNCVKGVENTISLSIPETDAFENNIFDFDGGTLDVDNLWDFEQCW